jgi:hypothetical protein
MASASAASSAPEPNALVPLTVFDTMLQRTTFVTGWLVEGTLDATALAEALKRVTEKWRFLAGRVQSLKGNDDVSASVAIPDALC